MKGSMPTDEFMVGKGHPKESWFLDLIALAGTTEDEDVSDRPGSPNYYSIQGLEMTSAQAAPEIAELVFAACTQQRALMSFVEVQHTLDLTPTDNELQKECCRILEDEEAKSNYKCKPALTWFKHFVNASSCCLRAFRR